MNLWRFCSRVRRVGIEVAREYGLEPFAVIEAAILLQRQEREVNGELLEARRAARNRTGLSWGRICDLEDAGRDHASVAGLDVVAREVAREYPALGLGQGYTMDRHEHVDEAALLWELLRKPDPVVRAQHDESLGREAAEMVAAGVVPF